MAALLEEDRKPPEPENAPSGDSEADESNADDGEPGEDLTDDADGEDTDQISSGEESDSVAASTCDIQIDKIPGKAIPSESREVGPPTYQQTVSPDRFYDAEYRKVIRSIGGEIIDELGPITFRHLSDKIARAHGFQRTGRQIKSVVWKALSKYRKHTRAKNQETMFWPNGVEPIEILPFRGLRIQGQERSWRDVPYPEKLGLAIAILQEGNQRDNAAAMASKIGLSQLRESTRSELESLLEAAKDS